MHRSGWLIAVAALAMFGWACDDGDDSSGTGFIELSSVQLDEIEQRMLPPMERVEAEIEFRVPLIGDTTALQVVRAWDMSFGAVSFTEEEPYVEISRFEVDGDRVGSFNLYYDIANLQRIAGDAALVDGGREERYAEAWASADASEVAALYADDAEPHDGLAGIDVVGADAIGEEAERWATSLSNPSWEVSLAFAERRADPGEDQMGAIFTVTPDGCAVEVGIVFDTDEDGRITREVVHYDTATLRSCGWIN